MRRISKGSDRSFGLAMAAVAFGAAAWLALHSSPFWPTVALLSAALLSAALIKPAILGPLNTGWTKLGRLMNAVVSPILLSSIFFLLITPIAIFMRTRHRDALRLRLNAEAETYWVERDPPGPDAKHSFPLQF